MPGETTVTPLITPELTDVNGIGVEPAQTACEPLILPGAMLFTLIIKFCSLKHPALFISLVVTTSPSEKIDCEAV